MLVCSRCAGIYFGALITALVLLFTHNINIHLKFFFLSLIVMIIDVLLVNFNFYDYNKTVSFITGSFFGVSSFLLIAEETENFILHLLPKSKNGE